MKTLHVKTEHASIGDGKNYPIVISDSFCNLLYEVQLIKKDVKTKICIVSDTNVAPLYGEAVKAALQDYYSDVSVYVIPSGEENKNLDTVALLYEHLILDHFNRKDLLVALGGGVVGDMTGFTAATYLRGITFVQIPTTLLSQVDSSVGGKTGVDFLRYKNMVGAFYMPRLVYINTGVLKSLPKVQFASGMGEVIKYGLIQKSDFYSWLMLHHESINELQPDVLREMIYISCDCKRQVVEEDPTEKGIRAILNFGHTIGHAIEKTSEYRLFHGQCVSVGMVAAAFLSQKRGYLTSEECLQLQEILKMFSLPVSVNLQPALSVEDVFQATKSDKKMVGDHIRFILLEKIGLAKICEDLDETEIREAIAFVLL